MKTKKEQFYILREILVNRFGVHENYVTAKTTFQDMGADSLDVIELIMEIEDVFHIHIDDEAIPQLKSMENILKYIQTQIECQDK